MQSIAIAIQRGNAGIMVTASQQRRAAMHDRLVSRNRLKYEQPSAGGLRHEVSSAAAAATAALRSVSQPPAAVAMDIVEVVADGSTTELDRAGHATPVRSQAAAVLLTASDLTPYQRVINPPDRAVAAAMITVSDGDSWWEHLVPDAARAINARDALRHDAALVAADSVGPVAAGAAGTASGTAHASLRDTTACAAVNLHDPLAAAAGRDDCTDNDMTTDCARPDQETVVLSDADTEVLDASDSDSQADAADSSPDDAAARKCGGSILDNNYGVRGVVTLRTLRATGQLRLPE
jgi:hypothetical protein